jgi:hypothetical protein
MKKFINLTHKEPDPKLKNLENTFHTFQLRRSIRYPFLILSCHGIIISRAKFCWKQGNCLTARPVTRPPPIQKSIDKVRRQRAHYNSSLEKAWSIRSFLYFHVT